MTTTEKTGVTLRAALEKLISDAANYVELGEWAPAEYINGCADGTALIAKDLRAILDAYPDNTTTEWAVQYKTFRDGDFDKTIERPSMTADKFTEKTARSFPMVQPTSTIPARVVSRRVTPWQRAK